jgi:hypothetical protein
MIIPTLDQTEGVWLERTSNQGYHYVNAVFPKDTPSERAHRANCHFLLQRGTLQAEHTDDFILSQREWDRTQRYCRVNI